MVWGCEQHGLDLRDKGERWQGYFGPSDASHWVKWPISGHYSRWGALEERPIWGPTECEMLSAELVQGPLKSWNTVLEISLLLFSVPLPSFQILVPFSLVTLPHSFRMFHVVCERCY